MSIEDNTLLFYLGMSIGTATYCLLDDIKHYHILKFDLHGIITVIVLGLFWPMTLFKLWTEE